jgi:hypothetical protein
VFCGGFHKNILGEWHSVSPLAASLALQTGSAALHALKLLELGRGMHAGLAFALRSDLSRLKDNHTNVHARYRKLRGVANTALAGRLQWIELRQFGQFSRYGV